MKKNVTNFVTHSPFRKWFFAFLLMFPVNLAWGQLPSLTINEAPALTLEPLNLLDSCSKSSSFTVMGNKLISGEFVQISIDNPANFTLDANPKTNLISVPVDNIPATIYFTYTPNSNSAIGPHTATATVTYDDGANSASTTLAISASAKVSLTTPEFIMPPTNPTDTSFTLNWTKVAADSLTLRVYTKDESLDKIFLPGFPMGFNSGDVTSYTLTGLTKKITYYFTIQSHARTPHCLTIESSCLSSWEINGGSSGGVYSTNTSVVNNSIIYNCILQDSGNSQSNGEPGVGSNWQTYWSEAPIRSYGSMCKPLWEIGGSGAECPEIIDYYCKNDTVIRSVPGFVSYCVDGIFQNFPAMLNYRYVCIKADEANAQALGEPGVGDDWKIYWNWLGLCPGGGGGWVGAPGGGWIDSPESEEFYAIPEDPIATSIKNPLLSRMVYSIGNEVILNATAGEVVNIYNLVGQKIKHFITAEGENRITVPYQGLLIVRAGSETAKVVVR